MVLDKDSLSTSSQVKLVWLNMTDGMVFLTFLTSEQGSYHPFARLIRFLIHYCLRQWRGDPRELVRKLEHRAARSQRGGWFCSLFLLFLYNTYVY